jgi:hypothetical protein
MLWCGVVWWGGVGESASWGEGGGGRNSARILSDLEGRVR